MIKLKNLLIVTLILILIISIFVMIILTKGENVVLANGTVISNKKYGWGVKRATNHEQPDLAIYKNILDIYRGICIGSKDKKVVYLTFDQGYEAGYTPKILDVLKENNVKATFFITGHYLNSETDLVKRMVNEGHIVGNHTVNHYSMPDIDDSKIKKELLDLHAAVHEKTGYEMQYMRPPKGEFSERTLQLTSNLEYVTVMWSLAYDDFDEKNQKGEEYAKSKILDNIHPGAIILLHATSKDNANVLDYCIKEIRNMGYEIKNIDEFENMKVSADISAFEN